MNKTQGHGLTPLYKKINILLMAIIAILIGILVGLGSVMFRGVVAFFHNLLFFGKFSFIYYETVHTVPAVWGAGVIFVPVLGGIIVVWLIEKFAHDEKGLSVPEIMYKMRSENPKVIPSVALAKTLASGISIGSGASIGQEGPVIQLGAMISSLLCDLVKVSIPEKKLLIAMGIAAGTSAMFQAPMGGMAFAFELFFFSMNVVSVLLIAISAFTASFASDLLLGTKPVFLVSIFIHTPGFLTVLLYLILFILSGIITGLISALLIHGIYWTEDVFSSWLQSPFSRHIIAMLLSGIMLYGFMMAFGHYYIEGVGYATIQDCLNLIISNFWLLLLIFIGKFLVTSISLGSGASGGVFSPALFLGALSGTCLGFLFSHVFSTVELNPLLFVMAGMGAMIASTTGAPITAILLVFEMTQCPYSIIPGIITCAVACLVRKKVCPRTVYTLKLARQKKL